ncbi:sensor histidine kinase [Thiofilum flexile]|uniref:sensor histidine kinase n=1 Tax=Thiofilum flexile TaxID=125627 RepID=UPI000365DB9A|nr:HAMP domain-containing sensor histidine kinase [Thiofilum flexile]
MDTLKILVIDDDQSFNDNIQTFADYFNWQVESSRVNDLEEIDCSLSKDFDYIILDGKLKFIKKIIDLLDKHKVKDKVLFVSALDLSVGESYGFNRIYQKPIDLAKVNDDLRNVDNKKELVVCEGSDMVSECTSKKDILWSAFNGLTPAVTIHRKNNSIDLIIGNKSSEYMPFSIPFEDRQKVNLKLLKLDLDEKQRENSAIRMSSREDWNDDVKNWIHSRLYDTQGYYWLTRQVMSQEYLSTPLSAHDDLSVFMGKASVHLKKWGITRVRLYKVMRLYSDDKDKGLRKSYILKPLYESGGGFIEGDNWFDRQLICKKENPNSEHIFKILSDGLLSDGDFYTLNEVKDDGENYLCSTIEWGEAGTRALIPIKGKDTNEKMTVLGLLAIDQRADHLSAEAVLAFSIIDDNSSGLAPLTHVEMKETKGYFTEQLVPKLFKLLNNSIGNKLREWNTIISIVMKNNIESSESTNVDEVIKLLKNKFWNSIANIHNNKIHNSQDLINWYFLRAEDYDQLHVISGVGEIAEDRKKIQYFNNLSPFKEALDSETGAGYIIQDFQNWIKEKGIVSISSYATNEKRKQWLGEIGSWVGVHFKAHKRDYLMIVHAKEKNYFNEYRVRLLKHAAQRLSPLLLWENAERAKELFNRAIVHELATPLQIIEKEYKKLSKEDIKNVEDMYANTKLLHYMVENIKVLNQAQGWSSESGSTKKNEKLEDANLDKILSKLHFLYVLAKNNEIIIEISPAKGTSLYDKIARELLVKKELLSALIEIIFNLLHNAIKYTSHDYSTVSINMEHYKDEKTVKVYISNMTSGAMNDTDRKKIFLPYFRSKNTKQNSGGGLGLAVVKILCDKHGMTCEALRPLLEGSHYKQTFLLTIPVVEID